MKKRTKLLSALMTTCMVAGALTGCGSSADTTSTTAKNEEAVVVVADDKTATADSADAASGDVTEITYWYCYTDKIQENNIELAEKFNETIGKEKGIHVTAEYQGTYDECHQKLQAAYVAGEAPNISVMEISTIRRFAENGVLAPIDSYVAESGVDMSDFYDALVPNCYVNEVCYGLPYLRSTPIMYCNNTLLKEAGWEASKIKTWDDLREAAVAVHDKTGKYGITQYSYIWTLDAFMIEHGSAILNEDETAVQMNTPEGKEVVGFFKDLIDQGVVHAHNNTENAKVDTDVQNQDAAIWFSSTGGLTNYQAMADELGFELATAFIPMETNYGTPTGGCCVVMMEGQTPEEEAATWEFMKFMTETEQAVQSSIKTGYLVSRKSGGETEEMQAYFKENPLAKVALDQLDYVPARAAYSNPNYTEAAQEIVEALDAIYINGADIDSTLADLEAKANKILNQ